MPTGSSSESKLLRLAILHHELAARGYGLGEITLSHTSAALSIYLVVVGSAKPS